MGSLKTPVIDEVMMGEMACHYEPRKKKQRLAWVIFWLGYGIYCIPSFIEDYKFINHDV